MREETLPLPMRARQSGITPYPTNVLDTGLFSKKHLTHNLIHMLYALAFISGLGARNGKECLSDTSHVGHQTTVVLLRSEQSKNG